MDPINKKQIMYDPSNYVLSLSMKSLIIGYHSPPRKSNMQVWNYESHLSK